MGFYTDRERFRIETLLGSDGRPIEHVVVSVENEVVATLPAPLTTNQTTAVLSHPRSAYRIGYAAEKKQSAKELLELAKKAKSRLKGGLC